MFSVEHNKKLYPIVLGVAEDSSLNPEKLQEVATNIFNSFQFVPPCGTLVQEVLMCGPPDGNDFAVLLFGSEIVAELFLDACTDPFTFANRKALQVPIRRNYTPTSAVAGSITLPQRPTDTVRVVYVSGLTTDTDTLLARFEDILSTKFPGKDRVKLLASEAGEAYLEFQTRALAAEVLNRCTKDVGLLDGLGENLLMCRSSKCLPLLHTSRDKNIPERMIQLQPVTDIWPKKVCRKVQSAAKVRQASNHPRNNSNMKATKLPAPDEPRSSRRVNQTKPEVEAALNVIRAARLRTENSPLRNTQVPPLGASPRNIPRTSDCRSPRNTRDILSPDSHSPQKVGPRAPSPSKPAPYIRSPKKVAPPDIRSSEDLPRNTHARKTQDSRLSQASDTRRQVSPRNIPTHSAPIRPPRIQVPTLSPEPRSRNENSQRGTGGWIEEDAEERRTPVKFVVAKKPQSKLLPRNVLE